MQSFIIWITFTLLTTYWTNPKELESNNETSNIDFKEQKNVPNKTINSFGGRKNTTSNLRATLT